MGRAARRLAASAVVQRARERHDPQHRHGAEDRGGQDGERERERRDRHRAELAKPWQIGRPERHEQAHAAPRERQADDGPGNRGRQALGQEIPRDAETAGAEGPADGDLRGARFDRTRKRLATFAHATSSTRPTAASRIQSARSTDRRCISLASARPNASSGLYEHDHRRVVRIGARQVGDEPRQFGADVGRRHPVTRATPACMKLSQIGSRFTCSGIQTSTRGSGNA